MPTVSSPFPDRQTLTRGLTAVFNDNGASRGPFTVVRREPAPHVTSFPCEIVRGRFKDGSTVELFCKYANGNGACSHGQRGGVDYEIEVYRQVLQSSKVSTPTFYGTYTDRKAGSRWLILEYMKRSMAVGKVSNPAAMRQAVCWSARFHAEQEGRLASRPRPKLTVYDAAYYRGWARRTVRYAGDWHERFPWLRPLCKRLEKQLCALAERPRTIIHGEYYPHNILFQRGAVRPVDWETAAIAPGEIDLATLTDGWARKVRRELEAEYVRTRWPKGPPPHFKGTLDLARIYVQLRWLGDQPEWTNEKGSLWRFQQLRYLSERCGLLYGNSGHI